MRGLVVLVIAGVFVVGCDAANLGAGDGEDEGGAGVGEERIGLDAPAYLRQCFVSAEEVARDYALQRVYPQLTFSQPLAYVAGPTGAYAYVVERAGQVWRLAADEQRADRTSAIDLTGVVDTSAAEAGLVGLAFSPRFALEPYVYLSYTVTGTPLTSRVVRYHVSADGTFDAASALLIIEVPQPAPEQNGGQVAFGPDGMLYIALGDGGGAGDPYANGQNPQTLLGALLRLDVRPQAPEETGGGRGGGRGGNNQAPVVAPYAIPEGNAFPDGVGGAPEIFAWGFRHVRHFSFDRANGQLWAGDAGQSALDEINQIQAGGNYGWPIKEGTACVAEAPCNEEGLLDPVYAYDRLSGDRSITGGYVYRGNALPELDGRYIFGDVVSGRIWALKPSDTGYAREVLVDSPLAVASFGETQAGELRLVDFNGGGIWRLVSDAPVVDAPDGPPPLLSQTGCFTGPGLSEPVPGLIGYEVAHELWSDDAGKQRYFGLPEGTRFEVGDDGRWTLPPGGVAIKHFDRDDARLETRFITRDVAGSYRFFTYAWLEDGSDATLVPPQGQSDAARDWAYPRENDCTACHSSSAGRTLGFETRQLNGNHIYAQTGRIGHQLATYEAVGFVEPVERVAPLAGRDSEASAAEKARAYLHVNCASCHRAAGPTPVALDVRFDRQLTEMFACDYPAVPRVDIPLTSPRILVPGSAGESMLHARMVRRDRWGMPSVGSSRIDDAGAAWIAEWIDTLASCP